MKRIDERDELGLAFAPPPALPRARELQRSLVRLRSGVAEEDARQPRSLRQALGELPLIRVVIKVRRVQQVRLIAQRLSHSRVVVAQDVDADARDEIEITLALVVVKRRTFSAHEH